MDKESSRFNREYLWFAMILMAVLLGSAAQHNARTGTLGQSQAALTLSGDSR